MSMIVHDLDVVGRVVSPDEANAPLIVDPDRVLTPTITMERFEAVSRGDPEIFHGRRGMEEEELAIGRPLDIGR
jgi:hypothetical protein